MKLLLVAGRVAGTLKYVHASAFYVIGVAMLLQAAWKVIRSK